MMDPPFRGKTMPIEPTVFRPIRESTLPFRGKEFVTAYLKDGNGYVTVRSICAVFGLDVRAQRKRLMRKQNFYEHYTATILMNTPGGPQKTLCLLAQMVPMFLAGVELDRVQNPEAYELLHAFQQEASILLAEHFGLSERGEMQFMRESMARMVAEQEAFEEALAKKVEAELAELRRAQADKVDQIRAAFSDLRQQVTRIEAVAGPKTRLTPEQLGQLRQATAALGALLQERGVAKPYPGIYMDITRLTGVSRSEDIRQEDFAEVVAFLENQIKALTQPAAGKTGSTSQPAAGSHADAEDRD